MDDSLGRFDNAADRLALFRLSMADGLGPVRLRALCEHFGSAAAALAAGRDRLLAVLGIGPQVADSIKSDATQERAEEEYSRMLRLGVRLLFDFDAEYPPGLKQIATAPVLLQVRGEILPADRVAVAIVGSRRCTSYGRRVAERLAGDLAARGVTIVSGLARGVDGIAHRAAMQAGGRTIAVLASGLANVYPPEHLELAEAVAKQGAVLSEASLDGAPLAGLFPQRNRLISGISLGVIVVEAAAKSGTLSTAQHALEQNREVFAVPGRIGDPASEGTNQLIKQGACLVRTVDDVLEQLGPIELPLREARTGEQPAAALAPKLSTDVERKLWNALETDEVELEILLQRTGLRASEASSALLMLEMRKLVRRLPGNRYCRATL